MILKSGKCFMGKCGTPTDMIDTVGNTLFVGDVVAISFYDKDKFNDFCGLQYVCENATQDDGLERRKFVMGIATEYYQAYGDDGYKETIIYQNSKEWRLKKIKGYEKVVDGEVWGIVKAVKEEEK